MIRRVVQLRLECGHEVVTGADIRAGIDCKACDEVVATLKRYYAKRDPWQLARTIGAGYDCLKLLEKEGLVECAHTPRGGKHWRYKEQDDADI